MIGSASPVLVTNMEMAGEVFRRLKDDTTRTVVYDCETTGLHWPTNYIVGHVITFGPSPHDTYYIPVRHGAAGTGRDANVIPGHQYDGKKPVGGVAAHPFEIELDQITRTRRDLHWIGHNLQFDLMFNYGHGVEFVGTFEDTQSNACLLDEHQHSFSLESCCKVMGTKEKLGKDLYEHLSRKFGGAPERGQIANYWRLDGDDPIGFDYGAGDGEATWLLRERQLQRLEGQNLLRPWKAESDTLRVIHRMAKRGIRIDLPKLDEVITRCQGIAEQSSKNLPEGFNVRSSPQIKKLMLDNGVTDWPTKPPTPLMIAKAEKLGLKAVGNPEFNEAFLKSNEMGRHILGVRKYSNICNSFAIPLRERHVHADSRVRATFHPMRADDFGTVTGRLSCSDPNLQQVPKRNKELAQLFRQVFLPDEGMEWWDADLSQCEPRLLAHYSKAEVLVNGYLADPPVDAHTAVAVAAGIDREDGKRLNQTLLTGGGLTRIREMLGDRADEVYNQYFDKMPEIKNLQKQAASRMTSRGFVISLMGRRARLDDPKFSYKAVNRLLQCGNADIIKDAMVKIDRHLEENGDIVHMLNTVHDALSFQAHPTPESRAIVMEALRLMVDYGPGKTTPLLVPMGAEYGVGTNWADATFTKDKHYLQ